MGTIPIYVIRTSPVTSYSVKVSSSQGRLFCRVVHLEIAHSEPKSGSRKLGETRMRAQDHRAGLVRVFVSRCGWATLSSIQVAVLMHAAPVKLEGCPPAVDFLPCWRFLYEKVYNLNRSAPFLKYAPGLCYTGLWYRWPAFLLSFSPSSVLVHFSSDRCRWTHEASFAEIRLSFSIEMCTVDLPSAVLLLWLTLWRLTTLKRGRTVPLTSKVAFYIFIQQI